MKRRYAPIMLAALAAIFAYGCTLSDTPTGPRTAPADSASQALLGSLTGTLGNLTGSVTNLVGALLVRCEPLPARSATRSIGRSGGRIDVGPHSLVIPAGALSRDTRITAYMPGDDVASVQFGPEGLKFAKKATLTLSYSHCKKLLPLPIGVVYTSDDLRILELLSSRDDFTRKTVTAPLDHFSRYAAAYRNGGGGGDVARDEGLTDGAEVDGVDRRSQ